MKRITLLLSALLMGSVLFAQPEVMLLDSTVLSPSSIKVKEPIFGKAWLSVDDTRYEFKQVLHYRNADGFFRVVQSKAGNFPSIYKQEKPGSRLTLYSQENWVSSAPRYSPGFGGGAGTWTGGYSQKVKTYYYSKGAGPIWTVSIDNINREVKDNPDALAAVNKAKKARSTGAWLTTAGVALTIVGAVLTSKNIQEENSKPPPHDTSSPLKVVSPTLFVGIALIPGFTYVKRAKERRLMEAIDIYNR
ncbi:MAG: hypothetical protein IT258_23660 [Saprospiraceae bacterium]|nr:hypothetical protein [Saprospiraceae bacterium]